MRAVRSDKKTSVNPIVTLEMHDALSRLAYVCDCPLKAIGETLVYLGLNSYEVISSLSERFHRPYQFTDYVTLNGSLDRPSNDFVLGPNQTRITLRLPQWEYRKVKDLRHAMDLPSLTKTVTILIATTMHNQDCLGDLFTRFVYEQLDEKRLHQLHYILNYINNGDRNEPNVRMSVLLHKIHSLIGDQMKTMANMVNEWLDTYMK